MLSSFSFSEDTVGYVIDGKFDTKVVDKLQNQILKKIEAYDKINLYLEDNGIEKFTMSALIEQILFKFDHSDSFYKIALVSDRKWLHLCGTIENLFLDGKVRSFESDERMDAISWIAQRE